MVDFILGGFHRFLIVSGSPCDISLGHISFITSIDFICTTYFFLRSWTGKPSNWNQSFYLLSISSSLCDFNFFDIQFLFMLAEPTYVFCSRTCGRRRNLGRFRTEVVITATEPSRCVSAHPRPQTSQKCTF